MVKIVLIGPDCCGKTTLARRLSAEFNMPIVKGIKKDFGQIKRRKKSCIFDRISNIDERIYTNQEITDYDIEPLRKNCIIIYIDAPLLVLTKRFQERGDAEVAFDDIVRVKNNYESWIKSEKRLSIIKITSNYNQRTIDKIGKEVLRKENKK